VALLIHGIGQTLDNAEQLCPNHSVILRQAGGEAELAMQMWWRAAALESLQAYVAGPLRKADPMEQANLARSVAALLQPTLAAVSAHPPLQACS